MPVPGTPILVQQIGGVLLAVNYPGINQNPGDQQVCGDSVGEGVLLQPPTEEEPVTGVDRSTGEEVRVFQLSRIPIQNREKRGFCRVLSHI